MTSSPPELSEPRVKAIGRKVIEEHDVDLTERGGGLHIQADVVEDMAGTFEEMIREAYERAIERRLARNKRHKRSGEKKKTRATLTMKDWLDARDKMHMIARREREDLEEIR